MRALCLLLAALVLLSACSSVQYQCADGSFANAQDECPAITPQEEKVVYEERVVTREILKYQCANGTIVDSAGQCSGESAPSVNPDGYYFLESYDDYARYIKRDLQILINQSSLNARAWRGEEGKDHARRDGKIYLVMYKETGDTYRFWAVEVNGENGAILRHREVTIENEIDYHELWWYDAGPRPATNETNSTQS